MVLIDDPVEQTTAITDLILCITSLVMAIAIKRAGHKEDLGKSNYWTIIYLLLGFASGTGAVAHGFEMSDTMHRIVWTPLYLSLGIIISFFLGLVILEVWGPHRARRSMPYLILIGLLFFFVTIAIPSTFLIFIIFEGMAMVLAFIGFLYLSIKDKDRYHIIITSILGVAMVVSIIAAFFQTSDPLVVKIIWKFDENSFFHLLQAGVMIYLGLVIREHLRSLKH
jgi:hypothetical protein